MSRGIRFLAQLAVLPALWALSMIDVALFQLVVGISVLVGFLVSWAVALGLVLLARIAVRHGPVPASMTEAADTASTIALIETGIALPAAYAVARALRIVDADPNVGRIMLVGLGWALVLVAVPAYAWVSTLVRVWLPMIERRRE